MTMLGLFITAILLVLKVTDARKDTVLVNQWNSPECRGHVHHPPFEVKSGECKSISADSIRVHHPKDSHFKWFKDINEDKTHCSLIYYSEPNCVDTTPLGAYTAVSRELPQVLEQCLAFPFYRPIRSVKFNCTSKWTTETKTETAINSAWSLDAAGNAIHAPTSVVSVQTTTIQRVTLSPQLSSRGPSPDKYIWLKSPFTGSPICFRCLHKKSVKFECKSSLETQDKDCGPYPAKRAPTPPGVVPIFPVPPTIEERGQPKRKVRIQNPFGVGKTCGHAKWKHAGEDRQEIVIQGPKKCPKEAVKAYPVDIE